jgi:SAM-dependent methyltransferase
MMRNRASTAAIIVLAVILGVGCTGWRGFGFRATGPEMPRLRHELALKPGMSVADVGAGGGKLTVALAAEVGPSGQVFSTDIDTQALERIRARVAAAALQNVTVMQAHARDSGLPTNCCDAVVLRRVYHHLSDPMATNGDLRRALRPGGVLAIIDFPPMLPWLWSWAPNGVPQNRRGHGIAVHLVVEEVTASGFETGQGDGGLARPWAARQLLRRLSQTSGSAMSRAIGGPRHGPSGATSKRTATISPTPCVASGRATPEGTHLTWLDCRSLALEQMGRALGGRR